MKLARLGAFILVFLLGWLSSLAYSEISTYKRQAALIEEFYDKEAPYAQYKSAVQLANPNRDMLRSVASEVSSEVASLLNKQEGPRAPPDRITEKQIYVFRDKVILDIPNAEWASFTPTHSMEPVLNENSNAIEVKPSSESEIQVGDIIAYRSEYAEGTIIHRVISIGSDEKGWFCIAKGDNNPNPDPGKIRFSQIESVVVAIIY
ncbi:MAG: signal peptidase I [Candidatus Woesearchaeota archaeon]